MHFAHATASFFSSVLLFQDNVQTERVTQGGGISSNTRKKLEFLMTFIENFKRIIYAVPKELDGGSHGPLSFFACD